MTDREKAVEILKEKYEEYTNKYPEDNWSKFEKDLDSVEMAIDAMIAFRNEGMREELIKFYDWIYKNQDKPQSRVKLNNKIDEYLKTK